MQGESQEGEGGSPFGGVSGADPLGVSGADDPFAENSPPQYDSRDLRTSNDIMNQLAAPSLNTIGKGNYPSSGGDIMSGDLLSRLRRLVRKL
jgi:hypothetical protein